MIAQFYQELEMKEEPLAKLYVVVQETKESRAPLITIVEASNITETSMVLRKRYEFILLNHFWILLG